MSQELMEICLREKKSAKTKISLTTEFMDRLRNTPFDKISIVEVCGKVEVAEGTFYNYFSQKIDVLHYALLLSDLKMSWEIFVKDKPVSPLAKIIRAFEYIAKEFDHSYLLYEIIATFLKERSQRKMGNLSKAEKMIAFPECEGISDVDPVRVEDILYTALKEAVAQNQLPETIDIKQALISLRTILVGVPLSLEFEELYKMGDEYKRQLGLIWKAIGK